MYCYSKIFYSQYHAVLENDGIVSLNNSKVLPYTLQEFCHIIFTKMCSNLSCVVQNTVVINTQRCIDILMSKSTGTICCVNIAALCIIVLSYLYHRHSIIHSTVCVKYCSTEVTSLPCTLTPAYTKLVNNIIPCMQIETCICCKAT